MSTAITRAGTVAKGKASKATKPAGAKEGAARVGPAAEVPAPRPRATAGERATQKLAAVVAMAGDVTRLRVLALIGPGGEICVGAMARSLGVTQPALSHHLKLMRSTDVIESRRVGKEMWYSLTPRGEILARLAAELGSAG